MLEDLSVRIVKDERFGARIEVYEEFCDYVKKCSEKWREKTPEKTIETMADQAHEINNKLHQAASPFGRSGDLDKDWYSEMISCWNTLFTRTLTYIASTESKLKRINERGGYKPGTQKAQAVQKLRYFFESIFLDCALTVGDLSWFDRDVTGAWIGAMPTLPVAPGGYPPTTMQRPALLDEVTQTKEKKVSQDFPKPINYTPGDDKKKPEEKTDAK